jgi:hypothetical protein
MFNITGFLRSLSEYRPSLMYYASSGVNGGCLLDYDDYDTFVFSDYYPHKFGGTRTEFFRRFLQSCGGKKIELVAATPKCRLFHTSADQWALFLFTDNRHALKIIQKSEINIEGFCGYCDGCCEGGNDECCNDLPFMKEILGLMGARMRVITDHAPALLGVSRGEAWLPAVVKEIKFPRMFENGGREFRVSVESKTAPGFPKNVCVFCVERVDGVEGYMRRIRREHKTPFSLK